MRNHIPLPRIGVIALGCTILSAHAHTGHGTHSFVQGLGHPLGMDHLLAMLAVGVWSTMALPAQRAWQGPASFMVAMVIGAAAGALGLTLPFLEHAIALSVVVFGALLMMRQSIPPSLGLGLIMAAASLHGLAHGAEAPDSSVAGYAIGFLLTTTFLHCAGIGLGLSMRHLLVQRSHVALRGLGAVLAGAGMYLFTQA